MPQGDEKEEEDDDDNNDNDNDDWFVDLADLTYKFFVFVSVYSSMNNAFLLRLAFKNRVSIQQK